MWGKCRIMEWECRVDVSSMSFNVFSCYLVLGGIWEVDRIDGFNEIIDRLRAFLPDRGYT